MLVAQIIQASVRLRDQRSGWFVRCHGLVASDRGGLDVLFGDRERWFQELAFAVFRGGELLVEQLAAILRLAQRSLRGGDRVVERSRVLVDAVELTLGRSDLLVEVCCSLLLAVVLVPGLLEFLDRGESAAL